MRLRARIDSNQPEIALALRQVGCSVEFLHQVGRGVPDLLVYAPMIGKTLLIEVKVPGEKLSPDEARWHAAWRGEVYVIDSVEEALACVGVEVIA